jgi:phage shock protein C
VRIVYEGGLVKRRLAKSRKKWLFGVAGGLAEYLGVPPVLIRAAFVVATAFSIFGVVAYAILFVWMPKPPPEGE